MTTCCVVRAPDVLVKTIVFTETPAWKVVLSRRIVKAGRLNGPKPLNVNVALREPRFVTLKTTGSGAIPLDLSATTEYGGATPVAVTSTDCVTTEPSGVVSVAVIVLTPGVSDTMLQKLFVPSSGATDSLTRTPPFAIAT